MAWRDVVRRDVAAVAAASQRHRRVESGRQSDRPVGRRRVDDNPERRLLQTELENHLIVLRMNGHRVAHSAVAQDLFAALAAFSPVLHDIVRKHRTQLLDRERVVAADSFERRHQHARLARNADAAFRGDRHGRLADERRIGQALRRHQHFRQRVHLALVHEVRALRLKLALDLFGDRFVDDDRVFRGAEDAVVERLAGDDVVHRLFDVRGALDVRRRVARADAVRRLACAVRGAHETHPAGREDHRDVAMFHQLLRAFERDRGHPTDRAGGRAGGSRGFVHHLRDPRDAFHRGRMRAEDNRATRFQRDQDFVNGRRGRVRGRHDGRHDTEGLRDLDDAAVLVTRDDADGLHRPDEGVNLL